MSIPISATFPKSHFHVSNYLTTPPFSSSLLLNSTSKNIDPTVTFYPFNLPVSCWSFLFFSSALVPFLYLRSLPWWYNFITCIYISLMCGWYPNSYLQGMPFILLLLFPPPPSPPPPHSSLFLLLLQVQASLSVLECFK